MTTLVIVLTVLIAILSVTLILLIMDRLKDFRILRLYSMADQSLITYFELPKTNKPGMINIILESKDNKPFYGLIGITFGVPLIGEMAFKCYGYIKSDREGKTIFSIYNKKGDQCLFFLSSRKIEMKDSIIKDLKWKLTTSEIFLKSR